jgi:predicted dehydrogenase/threonine dehydrogenase-like Zn-dependent dehydrogenase
MKQILQSLRTGVIEVAGVPVPSCGAGDLRIATTKTLISTGTERMMLDFGRGNWLDKARQQPDKVRMVLEKAKTDGIAATLDAVRSKLDQPLALGYCNVGRVEAVGRKVSGFQVGDRVVSNGKHAEVVSVPVNLCARIPDGVSDDAAAFTVVAAIGLQGIRLVQPTLGETVVVTGLGLIGLLTVQLLKAQGCRVLGLDFDADKLKLAASFGAEVVNLGTQDPLAAAEHFSRGRGVDAVIITAATSSNEPMHQAALMCRKRGRIVLVGVTGLELSRDDFFKKELSFQVSCSYGPGRYDPQYEEQGHDYPVGYVRWTEQRNFEAVLDMMADGRLDLSALLSHRFQIDDAAKAYEVVGGSEPSLGITLEYPAPAQPSAEAIERQIVQVSAAQRQPGQAVLSLIGAGNYATAVLAPAFAKAGASLASVVSNTGVSALHVARKNGFSEASTSAQAALARPEVHGVVIATRHDTHAQLTLDALAAGKHVFVEKPLCLTQAELDQIETQARGTGSPMLMVGFNRRFAPQVVKMKALLAQSSQPAAFVMTVNAGAIPAEHWTQDLAVGGGRIVGEACHFVDLLRHLAGSRIVSHSLVGLASKPRDSASIQLAFENGSIGTIHYLANGSKKFPKERLEVFSGGRILQLDNFRKLTGYGWPGFGQLNLWRQDKGQAACAAAFVRAVASGGASPIPLDELIEVSRVTIDLAAALGG